MEIAKIAVAASMIAALSACSKGSDSPAESTNADTSSGSNTGTGNDSDPVGYDPNGTGVDNTDMTGTPSDDMRDPSASGRGMNAPGMGTGPTAGPQPTGPGTAGDDVTLGGPGVKNSPSGATGSINTGAP